MIYGFIYFSTVDEMLKTSFKQLIENHILNVILVQLYGICAFIYMCIALAFS